jgi:hypothetical protein
MSACLDAVDDLRDFDSNLSKGDCFTSDHTVTVFTNVTAINRVA